MAMRAVNSFRTVSQLCRGNETVSAVRGASSGPAGQLTALAARGAARRASVLAMLLLVGEQLESRMETLETCRVDGVEVSDAQHHRSFGAALRASLLTGRWLGAGDGPGEDGRGSLYYRSISSYLEVPGGLPRRDSDSPKKR